MRCILVIVLAVFVATPSHTARAELIINLTDLGSGTAPGSMAGGGSLTSVMIEAAKVWELAYNDSSFMHTLEIEYDWANLSGGVLGSHTFTSGGGVPYRETSGMVAFNNSEAWFADSSLSGIDPLGSGNTEFQFFTESTQDYGGGNINSGREFTGATGDAIGAYDLFTIALHEIGHALGMSVSNIEYQNEVMGDNNIDIALAGLPFFGSQLPTLGVSNAHLSVNSALMYTTFSTGERVLPSGIDVLANAQISQFANPNYNLDAASVPEPTTYAAVLLSLTIVFCRFRLNTREPQPLVVHRPPAASEAHSAP